MSKNQEVLWQLQMDHWFDMSLARWKILVKIVWHYVLIAKTLLHVQTNPKDQRV
jgi:hypothetical protein